MKYRIVRRGFTLIEMLTVIGIVVILMAIAVPGYIYVQKRSMEKTAQVELKLLSMGLERFKQRFGHYPPQGKSPEDDSKFSHLEADPRILPAFLKSLTERDGTIYNARGQAIVRPGGEPLAQFEARRLVKSELGRLEYAPDLGYPDTGDMEEVAWLKYYEKPGDVGSENYADAPDLMYKDPFQQPYEYLQTDSGFTIRSYGPDGKLDKKDDEDKDDIVLRN